MHASDFNEVQSENCSLTLAWYLCCVLTACMFELITHNMPGTVTSAGSLTPAQHKECCDTKHSHRTLEQEQPLLQGQQGARKRKASAVKSGLLESPV